MDIVAPFFLKRNSCLVAGAFRICKSYAKSIFGCFLSAIADRDTKNQALTGTYGRLRAQMGITVAVTGRARVKF